MSAPQGVPAGRPPEEVDLWWGSYAGRAMTPSFLVCGVLTLLLYLGVRVLVPQSGWLQLTFVAMAGPLWLVQLTRFGHRYFTCTYRLTTRRLYVDRGFLPLVARRFELPTIARAEPRGGAPLWWSVGEVWIYFDHPDQPPLVLPGLVNPKRVAETIRDAARKARESTPGGSQPS